MTACSQLNSCLNRCFHGTAETDTLTTKDKGFTGFDLAQSYSLPEDLRHRLERKKYTGTDDLEYWLILASRSNNGKVKKHIKDKIEKLIDNLDATAYKHSSLICAKLIKILSLAYLVYEDKDFKKAALDIYEALQNKFASPGGAFYSSDRGQVIYTDENAEIIQALVYLYRMTFDVRYFERAVRDADALISSHSLPSGAFLHLPLLRGNQEPEEAKLADNLEIAKAFLQLYMISGDQDWLMRSILVADFIIHSLKDLKSGYLYSISTRDLYCMVELARYFNLLYHYTGQVSYNEEARYLMWQLLVEDTELDSEFLYKEIGSNILSLNRELYKDPVHLTVVGLTNSSKTKKLFRESLKLPITYLRLELYDPFRARLLNNNIEYPRLKDAAVFVCSNGTCSAPIYSPDDLKDFIR
jgi:uncharacterized protein YyaL (SSP411 family)